MPGGCFMIASAPWKVAASGAHTVVGRDAVPLALSLHRELRDNYRLRNYATVDMRRTDLLTGPLICERESRVVHLPNEHQRPLGSRSISP